LVLLLESFEQADILGVLSVLSRAPTGLWRNIAYTRQINEPQCAETEIGLLANGRPYAQLHTAKHGYRLDHRLDDFLGQRLRLCAGACPDAGSQLALCCRISDQHANFLRNRYDRFGLHDGPRARLRELQRIAARIKNDEMRCVPRLGFELARDFGEAE